MESIYFPSILHADCRWGIFNLAVLAAWSKSVENFGRVLYTTQEPWRQPVPSVKEDISCFGV